MATYDFKGKTILVTGAGAGIGKAICQKLTSCGAKVVGLSLLQNELDDLKKELPEIRTVQVDLRDWAATRKAVESIGPVDGLVNNAGVAKIAAFLDATEEEFDLQYGVNVKAVINVSQVVVKSMIENKIKGAIVNISSIAALVGLNAAVIYCGSKGAVQATTKVMALELGPLGIRVNSVNPTVVETNLSRPLWKNETVMKSISQKTPLGRCAKVEEVANAVAFLLSGEAAMINGIALPVDGGYIKALAEHVIYCGTKASVDSITRVMAMELGQHGIRVNSVNPIAIMTELGMAVWSEPKKKADFISRVPLGRFAEIEDVVKKVVFLLSDDASMISGSVSPIDGGFLCN